MIENKDPGNPREKIIKIEITSTTPIDGHLKPVLAKGSFTIYFDESVNVDYPGINIWRHAAGATGYDISLVPSTKNPEQTGLPLFQPGSLNYSNYYTWLKKPDLRLLYSGGKTINSIMVSHIPLVGSLVGDLYSAHEFFSDFFSEFEPDYDYKLGNLDTWPMEEIGKMGDLNEWDEITRSWAADYNQDYMVKSIIGGPHGSGKKREASVIFEVPATFPEGRRSFTVFLVVEWSSGTADTILESTPNALYRQRATITF